MSLWSQESLPSTMMHRLKHHAVAAALVLATVIGCSAQPQSTSESPASTVEDFSTEKLNEYRGQVVILNFWAAWCLPCIAEMPALEAVHREYRDRGVAVIGVNISETNEEIAAFAQKHELTFPMLRDTQRQAMKTYDVLVLPTTFFLDRHGDHYCWLDHSENEKCMQRGSVTERFLKEQIRTLLD
jgi:peroxiredoxin